MRIKSIHIKGLFDTFDHFIPFNQEDRITIIHAPNGFGKTIILKMLYGLLKMDFSIFEKIPFDSFVVNLDDDSKIEICGRSSYTFGSKKSYMYSISFTNKENKILDFYKKRTIEKNKVTFKNEIDEKIIDESLKSANSVLISLNNSRLKKLGLEISNWYTEFRKNNNVHLIETQRLLVIDNEAITNSKNHSEKFEIMTSSVSNYAIDLKNKIEDTLNQYAATSQNLERTFPNRLINQQKQENITIEYIKNELNNLEERRKKLQEVGLWDNENLQNMNFQIPQNTDSSSLNVLNLYIQDAKEKLAVFDNLEKKITLFKNIINSRFTFKRIVIDKKKGFLLLTHKNENLDSTNLSSGEQHQLVLLYEMLFKVKENDLVLIDEPEISLHIIWQEKLLSDLVKIIELNPFDVLIATHAPEIINDRWDLTVGLSKKKENV
jgi:predicted ATP-binding protein involved in virulence